MAYSRRAIHISFLLLPIIMLPACASNEPPPNECLSAAPRVKATLAYVVDGDTIVLSDKQTVRVLGINAPESRPSAEPQAREAARAAKTLLTVNTPIWLYPGIEKTDQYGRALAHVVTEEGRNLAEHLITQGLAASIAVQPNTRCAEHYQQLDTQARNKSLGIWRNPHPWQITDTRMNNNSVGFRLVTATVKDARTDRKHHHLLLANGLRVYMKNKLASAINAKKLVGQRVTVRGWVQWYKNEASLRLHHVSNLQVLSI